MTISKLAQRYYELRQKKENIQDTLKDVQKELDQAESELVSDLQQAGLNRVDLDGIGSFSLHTRQFYKIVDREAIYQFLVDRDNTDILTVNHQTLNGYVKELKEQEGEGFEIPGVSHTSDISIRLRKS